MHLGSAARTWSHSLYTFLPSLDLGCNLGKGRYYKPQACKGRQMPEVDSDGIWRTGETDGRAVTLDRGELLVVMNRVKLKAGDGVSDPRTTPIQTLE